MIDKLVITLIFALMSLAAADAAPRVSLLTADPGKEVYELEGHAAIRIVDDATGEDVVVNWGVFDFDSPNFIARFVAGQTDYLCVAYPTRLMLDDYRAQSRSIVEQELALDSLQTARLIALISANLRPENRVYRYNYVLDNCATRPLGLIEQAAGRQLIADEPTQTTFRKEMQRFHADYPWYQFGIDLALGRSLDRPITLRRTAFAPVTLRELIAGSGVVESTTNHDYGRVGEPSRSLSRYLSPMAVSLLVLLLAVGMWFVKRPQWFDSLLFGLYFVLGCVLTFLVFVSTHEATSPNLLLLWLNPFCLCGAVLPWIKSAKKAEICYFFVNFALLILLAVVAPLLGRTMNPAFWGLIAADAVRSIDNIRRLRCTKAARN